MGQATSTIFSRICCCGGGGPGGDAGKRDHRGLRGVLQIEEEITRNETLHSLQKPFFLHPTIRTPQQPCKDSSEEREAEEDDDEEEEEEVMWEAGDLRTGVWINHYCSSYKILLVGEGDFSFSASLAAAFGTAHNITATSLDSIGFLRSNYRRAMTNIKTLEDRGARVLQQIDATKMAKNLALKGSTFDRIIFNFPLSGFFPNELRESQLHRYRKLVRLFLKNAKKMIADDGEVHITHKSNGFFLEWNVEQLASREGLRLIEEVNFNFREYPGYRTKYGFGGDKNFN